MSKPGTARGDDGRGRCWGGKDVEEAPAEGEPPAAGPVPPGEVEAGDRRGRRRQEAVLEGVGDEPLLVVEAAVLEGGRDATGHDRGQRDVVRGVAPRRAGH